jgi:hypothetical protein
MIGGYLLPVDQSRIRAIWQARGACSGSACCRERVLLEQSQGGGLAGKEDDFGAGGRAIFQLI